MKKILLQTMPHTGTHTMHYLFNVLGGIEVVWHHWEDNCSDDIKIAKGLDWEDFVFVRTYRNPVYTLESYKRRAISEEAGEQYFYDCLKVFASHNHIFPISIGIKIDAPPIHKTKWALEVFRRCEVEPPEAALDYMKSWERINSQHDEDNRVTKAIKQSIHKGRVKTWHTK